MKHPVTQTKVRGQVMWKVNLRKRLTGDSGYRRRYFKTKSAATKFYNRLTKEITEHGAAFADLSEPVRAALAKFYSLLRSKSISLDEAAQLIEKHNATALIVTEAIASFYSDCADGRLELGTMREYRSHLTRFELKFGGEPVAGITKANIKTWLKSLNLGDRTQKNYITTLRTFFEFCMREETVIKNPAKLVRKPKEYAKTPVILPLEDIVRFVRHISVYEAKMMAPMAIALFAGVRTSELF